MSRGKITIKVWTDNMIALCISYKQHSKTFNNVLTIFISNNIECIPATDSSNLLVITFLLMLILDNTRRTNPR